MNQLPKGLQELFEFLIENGVEISMVKSKDEMYDTISYDLNVRAKSGLTISTVGDNIHFIRRYDKVVRSKSDFEYDHLVENEVFDLVYGCIKDPNVVDSNWRNLLVESGHIKRTVVPSTVKYSL